MTDTSLNARLVELETRQAFQDDTIAGLNRALVDQQQRLDQMEKMLAALVDRLSEADPEIDLSPEEPPHY